MIRSLLSLFRSHWLRLISMSMIFALVVMVITIVEQIIINIDTQIESQTKPLVGADVVVEQSTSFDSVTLDTVQRLLSNYPDARLLRVVEFYTTLGNVSNPKIVQVKWVEIGYPLYGNMTIQYLSQNNNLTGVLMDVQSYDLIGQSGFVQLWDLSLPVLGLITQQAELGFNFLDEGRSLIMPYDLVSATKLTDIWSRVEYQLQIAFTDDVQAERFSEIFKKEFWDKYEITLARNRIQQISGLVDQLDQYTSSILVITLLLSLTIMATATMTMTLKIKRSIAIMRVLWLTRYQVFFLTTTLYGSFFVGGSLVWYFLAYLLFQSISSLTLAQDFIRSQSFVGSLWWIVIISAIVSCRQPIFYLVSTHPLNLLQSADQPQQRTEKLFLYLVFAIGSRAILRLLTGKLLFASLTVVFGTVSMITLYYLLRIIFQSLLRFVSVYRSQHFLWFDAVRQTTLPGNQTALLVGGLSLALICFCVITSFSLSFLNRLRVSSLDQPNIFVLNVRTRDVGSIRTFDPQARLYDTILWRIELINNSSLGDHLSLNLDDSARAWEFTREFNITTVDLTNSPIIQGVALATGGISLDQDFAERLKVWLGDRIRLLIQGRSFDLVITSLRKSIRTGSEPFFYIQLDDSQFTQAPRSWFWVSRQAEETLPFFKTQALSQIGNHLSFVDISVVIALVTNIANKIIGIIIACMTSIIFLIICVSVASNEASALVAQQTYRLYYIVGMTKQKLISISLRIGGLYTLIIITFLLLLVPSILWFIYSNAIILTWSWTTLLPLLLWVVFTLLIMVVSYRLFHKQIIKRISRFDSL